MNTDTVRLILLLFVLAAPLQRAASGDVQEDTQRAGHVVEEARQVVGQPARDGPESRSTAGKRSKRRTITPRQESEEGRKSPLRFGPRHRTIKTVMGSLAVVLGAFFLLAWFLKRNRGSGQQVLPKNVIEVLGRAPLAGRQQMQLVRVGGKLILLCVTASGAETLTEITDPIEVERLAAACQASRPNSISSSFRQVLEQFGREPAHGFLDTEVSAEEQSTGRRSPRELSVEA